MKKLLDTTATLLLPAKAVEVAKALTAGDEDGWTYVPANPDGSLGPYSAINIYDEDGEFVAEWNG